MKIRNVVATDIRPIKHHALNIRQIWFVGALDGGYPVNALDISETWVVSLRSARLDIKGLKETGLVKFVGTKKKGYYKLVK